MSARNLLRWSGMAGIFSGVLIALSIMVHPSQETPITILQQEPRLLIGHWLIAFSLAFLLLGLPGIYVAQSERAGRLGLISFLMVSFGAVFFAISSNYGFIAPVLAAHAPDMLDAINLYPPEIALNILLTVGFLLGFILFGIANLRAGVFPRFAGVAFIVGTPLYLLGGVLALEVSSVLWVIGILGATLLGSGIACAGYYVWRNLNADYTEQRRPRSDMPT